ACGGPPKVAPIAALQTEYSLWSRDPEAEILPTVRELGITFVVYSPLGRGFLTGQFKSLDDLPADDVRRTHPRFQGENFRRNRDLVGKVERLAAAKGCTPSQHGWESWPGDGGNARKAIKAFPAMVTARADGWSSRSRCSADSGRRSDSR